jgi:glyoxylase-like metal-dependent hydrolase (beta-lactamase superfamily II)
MLGLDSGHRKLRAHRPEVKHRHTPGHTLESMSYLVDDRWLLTGDTLFLAAVGRPDLEASPEQARTRALLLHGSLQRIFMLDPRLLVLPAHTNAPTGPKPPGWPSDRPPGRHQSLRRGLS